MKMERWKNGTKEERALTLLPEAKTVTAHGTRQPRAPVHE